MHTSRTRNTSTLQAFALLTSFVYAGLAIWLILFIVFKWDSNMARYTPEFEVKVTRVAGNSETSGVIEEQSPEKVTEGLKF